MARLGFRVNRKTGVCDMQKDDVIYRQAAIKAVSSLCDDCDSDYCGSCRVNYPGEKDVVKALKDLPSAQPKHKKGRWLPDNRPGGGFWVCSECKFPSEAFAANVLYKFCPNCGADMRGEKDG